MHLYQALHLQEQVGINMPNTYFQFKQFIIHQDHCAMKVTTDGCLFGAWCSNEIQNSIVEIENVLDIGCGTGLLSLMVAQKNDITIDALEIDKDAALQATENIASSPRKNRITIIQADVLQWKSNKKYDCIISNPPFYETELKSGKRTKDIAHHDEGLRLSDLLLYIKNHLTTSGAFYLLLPAKREADIENLFERNHFHVRKKVWVKQSTSHTPFRLMIKGGNSKGEIITEEIAIKNENNEYSPVFHTLLKNYYLYL